MLMIVECPTCGKTGHVSDGLVGKRLRCKVCQTPFLAGHQPSGQVARTNRNASPKRTTIVQVVTRRSRFGHGLLISVPLVLIAVAVRVMIRAEDGGRAGNHPPAAKAQDLSKVADTVPEASPPARSSWPVEKAFLELSDVEKSCGDDYESVIVACKKFLNNYAPVPVEFEKRARLKMEEELPAKIDDRDYRRAADNARGKGSDGNSCDRWKQYLSRHPSGRHVDEARRKVEELLTWKVELVRTERAPRFSIDRENYFLPSEERRLLALVTVRFEAMSATAGTLDDRLKDGINYLSEDALDFLKGRGKIVNIYRQFQPDDRARLAKPARLFISNQVNLVSDDRFRCHPVWTSSPEPCAYGSTIKERASFHIGNPSGDPAVIRYIRARDYTVALVQPRKPVTLTLVFDIPAELGTGTLDFYDCEPITVTLPTERPNAEYLSDGKDGPKKLPGADGPLYEILGKPTVAILGVDLGDGRTPIKPDNPPRSRRFPTGQEEVFIGVKWKRRLNLSELDIVVSNDDGNVDVLRKGVMEQSNLATGEWTAYLKYTPQAGHFRDGPHQATLKVKGRSVALINWEVGGAS